MQFYWGNYDQAFLKEILNAPQTPEKLRTDSDETEDLVCNMNMICPYPDLRFCKKYRSILENTLLQRYQDTAEKVFDLLEIDADSYAEKCRLLRSKPDSKSVLHALATAIAEIGGADVLYSEYTKFKWAVQVDIRNTPAEEIPLFAYQEEAVRALVNHFITEDRQKGLLVMPTGSGKTRTAVYFLIKHMISQGYQILWIAHRHMLLDQAADNFYRFSGLSRILNPKIKHYSISCVSSQHMRSSMVDKTDTVVIGSIQALCRNHAHLRRFTNKKLMIVVDEAHHAYAQSYQATIRFLLKRHPNAKLLGLTATPVRSGRGESGKLWEMFDNNQVYGVSMSKLIAQGILATPTFIPIKTNDNFEPLISDDESAFIRKYKELPESLLLKMANCKHRNQVIVKTYLSDAQKYGKTLIFALNVLHCRLLCEELQLQRKNVRCGCIFSGNDTNAFTIEQFKKGKIDVLINVNIMTEGSDVPDIDTVFLTRPTQSEGFLMQMIGRGMRGTKAGGTERVNIVDFHDNWDVFQHWLNAKDLISEEIDSDNSTAPTRTEATVVQQKLEAFSWQLCKQAYGAFCEQYPAEIRKGLTLPVGWYSLIDEDGEDYTLLVFQDQIKGYKRLRMDKGILLADDNVDIEKLISEYFSDFCMRPSKKDIRLLLDNFRNYDEKPTIHLFEDRKAIDPQILAQKIADGNLNPLQYAKETYDKYRIVENLYGSLEAYQLEVAQALIYQKCRPVYGRSVDELPIELIPFDRTPKYDLDDLAQKVKDEMFDGHFDGITSIRWTSRPYKGYFGRFYKEGEGIGRIEVNSVLNSENVPEDVVKFILYHEMLHRDNRYHDKSFYELEHRFKNWDECDNFLDRHMQEFDIQDW